MCELKFGHNKRVRYIKGLARSWPLLLEAQGWFQRNGPITRCK